MELDREKIQTSTAGPRHAEGNQRTMDNTVCATRASTVRFVMCTKPLSSVARVVRTSAPRALMVSAC
eukprot:14554952-Alexandrium_andersonii.AAC.1